MVLKKCIILMATFGQGCCLVNFVFSNYTACENKPIKLDARFKMLNETYQLVDADYVASINIDDTLRLRLIIYYLSGKRWTRIADVKENGACRALGKYLGSLFFDILAAGGIKSRRCPVSKGSYRARNYHLDFRKLKFQTFPTGKMRFSLKVYDKTGDNVVFCLESNGQNKPL